MRKQKKIIVSILAIALVQMAMLGLSPVVAGMSTAFPDENVIFIQMCINFISALSMIFSLITGRIAAVFSKKIIALTGLALMTVGGVLGVLFHESLAVLYVWSAFIGAGIGLFSPIGMLLVADYFTGDNKAVISGMQTSGINCGGILFTILAGMLAISSWYNSYYCFLLGVGVFVVVLFCLPQQNVPISNSGGKSKFPAVVLYYCLAIILMTLIYNVFTSNVSLFVEEFALGSSVVAGLANGVYMGGGVVFGLFFEKMIKRFGEYLIGMALFALSIGFFLLAIYPSLPLLFLGAFIGGCSMSMVMPTLVYTVSNIVQPEACAMALTLTSVVSPNIGVFCSPLIFTPLSRAIGGDSTRFRFLLCSGTAVIFGIGLLLATHSILKRRPVEHS